MPLIRVVSRLGKPLAAPMQAVFGPAGGTLGRSPDCTLSLPDPNRHISRQQARVDVSGATATITCLSEANALLVNGQALRHGECRRLAHGDRIVVAEYELSVEADADLPASGAGDPFGIPDPFAEPLSPGRAGAPAGVPDDPFADLMPPGDARAAGAGSAPSIPDGFDPFDALPAPPLADARDR